MYENVRHIIDKASRVLVVQAENPDGDSLGSALALEEMLGDLGKRVVLYCPVQMPRHLRYVSGWDRVNDEWPRHSFDATIIVDTASATLLDRAIIPEQRAEIEKHPVLVVDHHATESDLPFKMTYINEAAVSTGELLFRIASELGWPINSQAAEHLAITILSDSLGLTTPAVTAQSVHVLGNLIEKGAVLNDIETKRREFMRKSPEILEYKGRLIQRISYHLDGVLALVHIPWEEIKEYSDQFNPSVLVLDEMRLVEGVRIAIAIKTYPDGKLTGKLRSNHDAPICETVSKFFGAGGHAHSSGFRVYESYDVLLPELISAVEKALKEYDNATAIV